MLQKAQPFLLCEEGEENRNRLKLGFALLKPLLSWRVFSFNSQWGWAVAFVGVLRSLCWRWGIVSLRSPTPSPSCGENSYYTTRKRVLFLKLQLLCVLVVFGLRSWVFFCGCCRCVEVGKLLHRGGMPEISEGLVVFGSSKKKQRFVCDGPCFCLVEKSG